MLFPSTTPTHPQFKTLLVVLRAVIWAQKELYVAVLTVQEKFRVALLLRRGGSTSFFQPRYTAAALRLKRKQSPVSS